MNDNIVISTSANLSGIQAVQRGLIEIRNLASEISQKGINITSSQDQQSQSFVQRAREHTQRMQNAIYSTIGANSVNQDQPHPFVPPSASQVDNWSGQTNSNYGPNTPNYSTIGANSRPRYQRFTPRPGTIPTPQSISNQYRNGGQGSPEYIRDWFIGAERNLTPGSAAHDEWHAANRSWVQGDQSAPETFYRRFASEANMVPVNNPSTPQRPATLTEQFTQGFRGRGQNASNWSAGGMAGAAGTLLGRALPFAGPVAAGLAIGKFATSSFDQYMDNGTALSDLTKQILSTKDSLESLQGTVNKTGAAMGFLPQETAKIANTLANAYGSISLSNLNNNIAQVTGMSRAYGVSADVLSQGFAGAAQMGITAGRGSSLDQGQLAFSLANSAAQSGMSGRMSDLMQEFLMAVQGTESTAPVANASSLLNIITSMNQSLPRSMTGPGGAAILNQVGGAVANPQGIEKMIGYQALNNAGVGGYFDIMRAQQQGPGYVLPNGQTSMEAIINQYKSTFGKNADYFMNQGLGISIPQADELLKMKWGTGSDSITSKLGIKPSDLSGTDWGKMAILAQLGAADSQSNIDSVMSDYLSKGGSLTDDQKKALNARNAKGDISGERSLLAQDILKGKYDPKTTTESIQTLNADVKSAQINITGDIAKPANDFLKKFGGGYDSIVDQGKTPESSSSGSTSFWDTLKNLMSSIGQDVGRGMFSGTPTAYNPGAGVTPGGYVQTANMMTAYAGLSGMNNAFPWLRQASNSNSGITQTGASGSGGIGDGVYHPVGSVSAVDTGNKVKDFITNMGTYAQRASDATGLPASFILAQWGLESSSGTSQAAIQNNNFAGIKPFGGLKPGQDSTYAGFSTIDDFVSAYVSTINSSRYAGARSAASNGAGAKTIGDLLHQEGYAEASDYGSGIAGYVGTEAKALDLSDPTLAKLSQAIATAISPLLGGSGSNRYLQTR